MIRMMLVWLVVIVLAGGLLVAGISNWTGKKDVENPIDTVVNDFKKHSFRAGQTIKKATGMNNPFKKPGEKTYIFSTKEGKSRCRKGDRSCKRKEKELRIKAAASAAGGTVTFSDFGRDHKGFFKKHGVKVDGRGNVEVKYKRGRKIKRISVSNQYPGKPGAGAGSGAPSGKGKKIKVKNSNAMIIDKRGNVYILDKNR